MSALFSPTPTNRIPVAAGLVFRQGRLLVTRRRPGGHLGGLWEFPGGKCEAGESFADALRRELREEVGIEVEVIESVEAIDHTYPEKAVHLEFFRCRWLANEPQPLGCAQVAWVSREELEDFAFPPADARLLDRIRHEACWWQA